MILDKIVTHKKKEIAQLKQTPASLKKQLNNNDFTLITEIKKASPSKGIISQDFKPLAQLKQYEKGGAGAISVLTDSKFFQGSNQILKNVREHTDLPVLRKEFIIKPIQVYESLFLGADIILLIAAILNQKQLNNLLTLTKDLGLEAIVEVHNNRDLKKVIETDADILGINNRDLHDFTVDLETTSTIINNLEKNNLLDQYFLISESGIKNITDIKYLKNIGIDGALIGETLMKSDNPAQKIKTFRGV